MNSTSQIYLKEESLVFLAPRVAYKALKKGAETIQNLLSEELLGEEPAAVQLIIEDLYREEKPEAPKIKKHSRIGL